MFFSKGQTGKLKGIFNEEHCLCHLTSLSIPLIPDISPILQYYLTFDILSWLGSSIYWCFYLPFCTAIDLTLLATKPMWAFFQLLPMSMQIIQFLWEKEITVHVPKKPTVSPTCTKTLFITWNSISYILTGGSLVISVYWAL